MMRREWMRRAIKGWAAAAGASLSKNTTMANNSSYGSECYDDIDFDALVPLEKVQKMAIGAIEAGEEHYLNIILSERPYGLDLQKLLDAVLRCGNDDDGMLEDLVRSHAVMERVALEPPTDITIAEYRNLAAQPPKPHEEYVRGMLETWELVGGMC